MGGRFAILQLEEGLTGILGNEVGHEERGRERAHRLDFAEYVFSFDIKKRNGVSV